MAKGYNSQFPSGDIDQSKLKSEDYRLLGGINSKVNLYSNGQAEFRDLSNLNFINTGALTKRPGTTLYPGVTFIGTSAGGVTSGIPDLRQITSGYEFSNLNGNSYLIISQFNTLYQVFNNGHTTLTQFNTPPAPVLSQIGPLWSFTTFVDHLFACNGSEFYRIATLNNSGSGQLNAYSYSLPAGTNFNSNLFQNGFTTAYTVGNLSGISFNLTASNIVQNGIGLSGVYVFSYAFVNDRGFVGPPSNGITLVMNGASGSPANYVAQYIINNVNNLESQFGATAILLMRSQVDGVVPAGTTMVALGAGSTQLFYDGGIPLLPTAQVESQDFDVTANYGATTLSFGLNQPLSGIKLNPRYLEVFNNQLFMAGFSTMPSTFWWSEIGEPEGVQPDFSDEVRSNDGDRITGLKSYLGSLVITKQRSFHLLSGTDPSNFILQELSDQYGCLSHRALVPWNNNLWFLDSKGIMEYNGANIRCVSTKIEPVFNNMNVQAAMDNACGVHVKQWNELWFAIPARGATINNTIIVYDYVADSWTHYDGLQAQCLFMAYAGFSTRRPFLGNYTGGLVYFDQTLTSDNDQGITCHFDSIFFSARGQSIQNQYRRFYLDVNPILGFTQPIYMTFQQDFGTTAQVSRTMYQNPFQSRIDFGISSRSIQASMYHYSASLPLIINGFTFESRLQRMV